MYLVQTVQTSSAWRPPMPLPNEGKANTESLERRSTQLGQITTAVHHSPNTYMMGGNGFESQYAITPEKKETPASTPASKDNKKWSIGGLFRRKKKAAGYGTSSEEEFVENGSVTRRSAKDAKKSAGKRTSKVGGFDHIVQVPTESCGGGGSQSGGVQRHTGSLDRQGIRADDGQQRNSSDDELLLGIRSCNSSNISRFRSDDSLMTNQSTPCNRKSRAARTERYLKRRSRDGEGASPLIVGGPYEPNQSYDPHAHVAENRWKTQPIMFHGSNQSMTPSSTYSSNYQHQQPQHYQHHLQQPSRLQNSNNLSQMPQIINFQMNYTTPQQQQHRHSGQSSRINPEHRSFSYDNYINQFSLPKSSHHNNNHHHHHQQQQPQHNQPQYANQAQLMNSPPPPPPRDPMRRLTVDTAQTAQSRPISYAFDKYNNIHNQGDTKGRDLGQRCVSDDHLWNQNGLMVQHPQLQQSPAYYSNMSMQSASASGHSPSQSRRRQTLSPGALDPSKQQAYKYVADATPRSRKPIHVLEDGQPQQQQTQAMNNYQAQRNKSRSATDFWKKIDQQVQHVPKEPQADLLQQPMAIKPRAVLTPQRSLDTEMKSNSLSRSYRFDVPVPQSCEQILNDVVVPADKCRFKPVNKYEEHIAKNMTVNSLRSPNMVAQQKKSAPSSAQVIPQWSASRDVVDCVKTKNLEDAINELEAIYKSLKLSDEELLDKADRRDVLTPTGFSKKVKEYQYDEEEDEDVDGNGMRREPDILLDDVAYRNLKHANNFPKVTDSQPPFGIPVGPIPPPAAQDYLKVTPISSNASTSSMSPVGGDRIKATHRDSPDLVSDDLAVRNLRKDNGQVLKSNHLVQPQTSSNKKKAVRSQSANIYNLIQRDASRPCGGNLDDYNVFDALSKKLINLTDGDSDATDVPVTVSALRKKENAIKPRDARYKTISNFLHPNNTNGAVFNLPSTLQQKPPIPTPRKSLSPYLTDDSNSHESKGIDVLNKLVMDAKISSQKLSKDLDELRKDGKVTKGEAEKSLVTSEAPLIKRIVIAPEKPAEVLVGPPKPARMLKRTPTPSSPDTASPQLKVFSPKIVDSGDSSTATTTTKTTPVVKEEVVLPAEKVNQLVDKFNERIKVESREASPVAAAVTKKSPVTAAPKKSKSLTNKIKLLEDINDASKAVRACEQMLVDVVQDTPMTMLNDKKLLDDINEVSLAVRGCEKILKGVIPMDGSDVEDKSTPERQSLVMDCELPVSVRALKEAFEKEPSSSPKVGSPVLVKSMESVSKPAVDDCYMGDYDNLQEKVVEKLVSTPIPEGEKIVLRPIECKPEIQREIDEIMKACAEVNDHDAKIQSRETSKSSELLVPAKSKSLSVEKSPPYSTPVEDFSSPMKSSSVTPSNNFAKSSSLTSFHAFSSSDYLKSPSSERGGAMSTFDRCVKSNSTTSYDVKSTTASLNSDETLSPVESKPSEVAVAPSQLVPPPPRVEKKQPPPAIVDQLVMTVTAQRKQEKLPKGPTGTTAEFVADPTDSSQYNSSEELAMIFGIRQPSVTPPTGNQVISFSEWSELESAVDEDDEIDLDRNNNSLSAINNNSFTTDPYQTTTTTAAADDDDDVGGVDSLSNPKSAAPKLHGLRYFGTKRNELEIIFENPHENGTLYEDPETEDLLGDKKCNKQQRQPLDIGMRDEVDSLDLQFTAEVVIKKDMSVCLESGEGENVGDKKLYSNELEINVDGGVADKESETEAFRIDAAVVGELNVVVEEQGLPKKKNVDEKGAICCDEGEETPACETSLNERGSDLESSSSSSSSSSSNNKSEAVANKLKLPPVTCNDHSRPESGERSTSLPVMGEGSRRRNRDQRDVANGKERPNLLHPEHFLFASMAYQGLSSYDDILTMLAILIALITLIALIFI